MLYSDEGSVCLKPTKKDQCFFYLPVKHTEKRVQPTEHQHFLVQQPVDAAFPPEEQLREATKSSVGHLQGVRHRHGCNSYGKYEDKY